MACSVQSAWHLLALFVGTIVVGHHWGKAMPIGAIAYFGDYFGCANWRDEMMTPFSSNSNDA